MAVSEGVPGAVIISSEPHDLVQSVTAPDKLRCVRRRDGLPIQVLPDGTPQYASDPTADGAYEHCTLSDDKRELTYAYNDDPDSHPDHKSRPHVHVMAWRNGLPRMS